MTKFQNVSRITLFVIFLLGLLSLVEVSLAKAGLPLVALAAGWAKLVLSLLEE